MVVLQTRGDCPETYSYFMVSGSESAKYENYIWIFIDMLTVKLNLSLKSSSPPFQTACLGFIFSCLYAIFKQLLAW